MRVEVCKVNPKMLDICVEEDDLCYYCMNLDICPLMQNIQDENVIPRYAGIYIENCLMYKQISLEEVLRMEDHGL